MTAYLKTTKELLSHFNKNEIKKVSIEENIHVNALTNLGSSVQTEEPRTNMLIFLKWSAEWKTSDQEVSKIAHEVTWITPLFFFYIHNSSLLDDRNEARKIKAKAARFTINVRITVQKILFWTILNLC